MKRWVALLRAVNVGGTGKLAMPDLRRAGESAGFDRVETYIASGNLVFSSALQKEAEIVSALKKALEDYMGSVPDILVRTADELADIVAENPFPDAPGNRVGVLFLNASPAADTLETVSGRNDETVQLGRREVFVHYPSGMGRSKLNFRPGGAGTVRNLNTVRRLAAMAANEG